jgi:hypothetical protein
VERRRDPWAPFRIWIALTIGLYALRAAFVTTWLGAIPGFVLLLLLLVALVLAGVAVLLPGRVTPYRENETRWWSAIGEDGRHGWRRLRRGGR